MPSATLTPDEIVRTAIELLDRDGLEGLNMRALGKRLRSAATAMYWHVGSKEDLVALASDRVWNEIALPDLTKTDWRTAATALATDLRAMLGRHPWLLQAFGTFVIYGPGKARYDDHSFAIYEAAGFTGERAEEAAAAVLTLVLGNALGGAAAAALGRKVAREGRKGEQAVRERMAKAREVASQFPRLRARLDTTSAADYANGPQNTFALGLEAILDGLEAQLESAGPTRRKPARLSSRSASTPGRPAGRSPSRPD